MVFSKMLAKDMHLIEFENCIFFFNFWRGNYPSEALEREPPLRHPLFKFSKIYKSSDKGIKTGKVGGFSDMIMYPIVYLKRFFSKMLPNGMYQIGRIEFQKWIFFSSSGGHIHPQTPPCPRKRGTWCWCFTLVTAFTALPLPGEKQSWICLCLSFVPFMLGLIKENVYTKYDLRKFVFVSGVCIKIRTCRSE